MAYSVTSRNAALTAIGALGTWLSLHDSDPAFTGASELAGGTPSYARIATAWSAAANGVMLGSPQLLNIPAGKTIGWFGVWTAASGGTFLQGGTLRNAGNTADITETYNQQGTYSLTPRLTADNL